MMRPLGRNNIQINSGGLATSPCALNPGHLHAQYRLYSQNIITLISTILILETFRLYSRSSYFDFILVIFLHYSCNISTLFLKYYDFNLVILDFYFNAALKHHRTLATLYTFYKNFIRKLQFFYIVKKMFFLLYCL